MKLIKNNNKNTYREVTRLIKYSGNIIEEQRCVENENFIYDGIKHRGNKIVFMGVYISSNKRFRVIRQQFYKR